MPVVVVTAPALADETIEVRALAEIAAVIAAPLGLAPEDVYVGLVRCSLAVLGRSAIRPWPVVMVHGRPRAAQESALAAARTTVAKLWSTDAETVWAQWISPA